MPKKGDKKKAGTLNLGAVPSNTKRPGFKQPKTQGTKAGTKTHERADVGTSAAGKRRQSKTNPKLALLADQGVPPGVAGATEPPDNDTYGEIGEHERQVQQKADVLPPGYEPPAV